jgi:hypothetical protein
MPQHASNFKVIQNHNLIFTETIGPKNYLGRKI